MSYTPSEGHGAKAEGRRGVPPQRGGTPEHSKQPSPQDSLRQREIEDLAQRPPLVPQADLGEAVPAHEGAVSAF